MKILTEYKRNRHSVHLLHAHLIFVTKYRRKVFDDQKIEILKLFLEEICNSLNILLKECNGEHDHIHLLIEYPPSICLIDIIKRLKGISSRYMRKFYSLRTHKDHLWSRSYFVSSCGGAPLEIIKEYVKNQRVH